MVFRDGPSGRRAALAAGPDVWEIVAALRDSDERGEAAMETVAADLSLTVGATRVALAYYSAYAAEIDAEVAENERVSELSHRSWEAQQRHLTRGAALFGARRGWWPAPRAIRTVAVRRRMTAGLSGRRACRRGRLVRRRVRLGCG